MGEGAAAGAGGEEEREREEGKEASSDVIRATRTSFLPTLYDQRDVYAKKVQLCIELATCSSSIWRRRERERGGTYDESPRFVNSCFKFLTVSFSQATWKRAVEARCRDPMLRGEGENEGTRARGVERRVERSMAKEMLMVWRESERDGIQTKGAT